MMRFPWLSPTWKRLLPPCVLAGSILCLGNGATARASATVGTSQAVATASSQDGLQGILQQRRALVRQEQALRSGGATAGEIQAWHQGHAAELSTLDQQVRAWSASQPAPEARLVRTVSVPADATPEMQEYLENRAALINSRVQLDSQAATGKNADDASALHRQWRKQNEKLLQRQAELGRILSDQSVAQSLHVPRTQRIPADASPQLEAFLTVRNDLVQQRTQLQSQYASATPAVRQAALADWRRQNAAKLARLRQTAQALSATASAGATNSSP